MSDRFAMNPELRELLGELGRDRSAGLLRVGRQAAWDEAREQRPRVGSSAPFLKRAERRLLEVHREEAARLLYRYMVLLREENPRYGAFAHYGDARPGPIRSELDRQAQPMLLNTKLPNADAESLAVLRACLSQDRRATPLTVLAAALRLAPSTSIRISQGLFRLLEEQDPAGSEQLLRGALAEATSGELASYAWENLGLVAASQDRYEQAMHMYGKSVKADSSRTIPKLSWLHFSLLSNSGSQSEDAAETVDASVPAESTSIAWFSGLATSGNRSQVRDKTTMATRQRFVQRFGEASRMIANG